MDTNDQVILPRLCEIGVQNFHGHEIAFVIEPFSFVYTMPPKAMFTIVLHKLQIDWSISFNHDEIIVYGFSDFMSIYDGERKLQME
jgi:hypothetical protein